MCDPVSAGMFALQAGGQIMQHQAEGAAVKGRNRAKLRNFEEQNRQYNREVILNNAEWKNEVQVGDIEQDQIYQAMVQQWSEQDQQLDKIFAQGDQNIEKAIIQMYENDYAGTQTGRTAARLAGKSAKKLGQYKSETLHNMMMARDETIMAQEGATTQAQAKSWDVYEKIRFAPIHGHTPMAPELEAGPSKGGLILGLAASALGAAKAGDLFKAPDIGNKSISSITGTDKLYPNFNANANIGNMSIARYPGTQFAADAGFTGIGSNWQSVASPNIDWSGMVSSGQNFAGSNLSATQDFAFGMKL